jgi:adenylyltransferase/sulfurtransferase
VGLIASIEAAEAIKILSGNRPSISRRLTVVDLWQNQVRQIDVSGLRAEVDCPACKHGDYAWLAGRSAGRSAVLCGRNAVQLSHPGTSISLDQLAHRLAGVGQLTRNAFLLRLTVERYELTIFPDGRAIISGTDDVMAARAIYAKYVGT